jgi:PASTA domain
VRRRVVLVILVLIGVVLLYRAIGGEDAATSPQSAAPNASRSALAPISSATAPEAPAPSSSPPSGATAAVPDVVGKRLTEAAQILAGAGFADVLPIDVSGGARVVVNPQNWIVREQDPQAGRTVPAGATVTLRVGKPSDDAGDDQIIAGVIPDVLCADLRTALGRLGLAGFTDVSTRDGLGRGRIQIIELNWMVIAQSAPTGSQPPAGATVVLTVVKYGEPTGTSGCRS